MVEEDDSELCCLFDELRGLRGAYGGIMVVEVIPLFDGLIEIGETPIRPCPTVVVDPLFVRLRFIIIVVVCLSVCLEIEGGSE